jgi:V/A-type H+-transporting ATPase subunit D
MAKLALNKSSLQKQRDDMRLFQRLLPSLELKCMQLSAELKRAQKRLIADQAEVEQLKERVGRQLPMLANRDIDVSGLVKVESIQIEEENLVGVRLPKLKELSCKIVDYSMLAKPHWVDVLVEQLKRMAELDATVRVSEERVRLLERAVRRITQRVNLFDKILIPTAKKNIKKIQIFLGDAERAAVSCSKLAKAMRQRERESLVVEGAAP